MAKRISVLVALEGADEGLKRAITSAERSLGELSTAAKTSGAKAMPYTGSRLLAMPREKAETRRCTQTQAE